jgi:hypothetical protein
VERLEDRFVPAAFTTADLHAAGEYLLQLINDARANPAATAARLGIDLNEGLAPGTISAAPKQPLAPNPQLLAATDQYLPVILSNLDAINSGQLNPHTGLNGTTPMQRDEQAGFSFALPPGGGQSFSAENFGQTPQLPVTIATRADLESQVGQIFAQLFVDKTEAGRLHRLNILNPDLQEVGNGVVVASHTFRDAATGAPFTSDTALALSDFASVSPRNAFLAGAAFNDAAGQGDGQYHVGDGLINVTITAVDSSGQRFQTTTMDAGDFSLALAPGTYTVTASGAGLGGDRVFQNVTVGSQTIRLDFGPNSPLAGSASAPAVVTAPAATPRTAQAPVMVFQPSAGAATTTAFAPKGIPGRSTIFALPRSLAAGRSQMRVTAFNNAGQAGPLSSAPAFTVAAPLPGQPTGTAEGTGDDLEASANLFANQEGTGGLDAGEALGIPVGTDGTLQQQV